MVNPETETDGDHVVDSINQEIQNTKQSGGLYNERGRDELVEYAARHGQQEVGNRGGDVSTGQGLGGGQKDVVNTKVLQPDEDEYDDDGGEEEVDKKFAVDSSEDLQSLQKSTGVSGTDHAFDGNSKDLHEHSRDHSLTTSAGHNDKSSFLTNNNKADGGMSVEKSTEVQQSVSQKLPKSRKKPRKSPSVYLLVLAFYNSIYVSMEVYKGLYIDLVVPEFTRLVWMYSCIFVTCSNIGSCVGD